jgi:hypothetical protein
MVQIEGALLYVFHAKFHHVMVQCVRVPRQTDRVGHG